MPTQKHTSKHLRVEPSSLDEFYPIPQFIEKHKDKLNENQLRHQLRNAETNGLVDCIVKKYGRIFIHDPSYLVWFASQGKH